MANRWHAIQWISIAVAIAALGVLLVCPFSFWGRLMLISIVISAMLVFLIRERRDLKSNFTNRLLTVINLLRHDWMNDVQVLFGYIRLKKHDQLEAYVHKMKTEILAQSQLCKIGLPELIIYLLTFSSQARNLTLEVEVMEQLSFDQHDMQGKQLSKAIIALIEAMNEAADSLQAEENILYLQMEQRDEAYWISLEYSGYYEAAVLQKTINAKKQSYSRRTIILESVLQEQQVVLTLRLPFQQK